MFLYTLKGEQKRSENVRGTTSETTTTFAKARLNDLSQIKVALLGFPRKISFTKM
jgi:hypothetical protein